MISPLSEVIPAVDMTRPGEVVQMTGYSFAAGGLPLNVSESTNYFDESHRSSTNRASQHICVLFLYNGTGCPSDGCRSICKREGRISL